ncbi:hypothetical protein PG987_005230 [Apiospora arundinis]
MPSRPTPPFQRHDELPRVLNLLIMHNHGFLIVGHPATKPGIVHHPATRMSRVIQQALAREAAANLPSPLRGHPEVPPQLPGFHELRLQENPVRAELVFADEAMGLALLSCGSGEDVVDTECVCVIVAAGRNEAEPLVGVREPHPMPR